MSARKLITENLDLWTGAVTKKSSSGRGSNGKVELTGVKKLRELILELAVRGRLAEQIAGDVVAQELVEAISNLRQQKIREGALPKFKTFKPDTEHVPEYDVPNLWALAPLGHLTLQITDGVHHTPNYLPSGVPFISVKDIDGRSVSFRDCKYISEEQHNEINKRCNPAQGDILLCRIGTLGRATIVDTDVPFSLFVSVGLLKMPTTLISSRYVHLALHSPFALQQMDQIKAGGSHTNKLNLAAIPTLHIPVPPLEEQHRIVQKVDELMALCDRLEQQTSDQLEAHETLVDTLLGTLTQSENATELADSWARVAAHFDTLFTSEQSIDKLKQTILQLAVMGRLVEQDAGDEPATELLKRIQDGKDQLSQSSKQRKAKPLPPISESEEPFSLPSGWTLSRLDDITDIQGGIAKGKKVSGKKTRILPYLRVANVQRSSLDLSEIKEIEITENEVERYLVRRRDLLITEGGDWDKVGRTAIWDGRIEPMAHQNHVFRARLILAEQNERWLERYLNSQFARDYFAGSSKQTTNLASINKTQLRSCTVPLPPLAEQNRIVQKVDELMAFCDQLKERLNQACETRCQLAGTVVEKALG